ncbi:hypothetical protein GGI25_004551 [Coemansia spiralis]|uniref:Uncharacterized protein n=1 Tax=Coemansia spiralis TaxID=417178 RepID=A0A9W8G4A0_9FUNG|nr:hypothetical protein GGI25_004551 [Coemansia spiralis]
MSQGFPTGVAIKETSTTVTFPIGTAAKEISSSSEEELAPSSVFEPESVQKQPLLSLYEPEPESESAVPPEKITVLITVYADSDVPTVTVTETDAYYYFSFIPGSVAIITENVNSENNAVIITEYNSEYVMTSIAITPSVSYTTEYITTTTTIPAPVVLASTITTTTSTTTIEIVTTTISTQDSAVTSTYIIGEEVTELSTLIDTSLQTEALWTQKLIYSSSTDTYTMRSLDRFQPWYIISETDHVTEVQTVFVTTTTQPPAQVAKVSQSVQPEQPLSQAPQSAPAPSSNTSGSKVQATMIYSQASSSETVDYLLYASNSPYNDDVFISDMFPAGTAIKETSHTATFPAGIAEKETSNSPEKEEPPLSSIEPAPEPTSKQPSHSAPVPVVTPEKVTVFITTYVNSDVSTVTVTETDTSYFFSFTPGNVSIITKDADSQSVVVVTAYHDEFVMTGITLTLPVSYTTEYITTTTTVTPASAVIASTIAATDSTTITETVTTTISTQDSVVTSIDIASAVVTNLSTLVDTSLQTEALWTQKLLYSLSTDTYTMRSLDRFQPWYIISETDHVTEVQTVFVTTTTQPPAQDAKPTPAPQPEHEQPAQSPPTQSPSSTTTNDNFVDPCAGARFYRLNQQC